MKMKIILYLVILVIISGACNSTKNKSVSSKNVKGENNMTDLDNYIKQGNEYFIQKDFSEAEKYFEKALEAAEKMQWTDGIVRSKQEIAKTYLARKDFEKNESILKEAIVICKSKADCSIERLESLFGNLEFLYLFEFKDESRSRYLIKEIESSENKLGKEEINRIICSSREDIIREGFKDLFAEINDKYKCEN